MGGYQRKLTRFGYAISKITVGVVIAFAVSLVGLTVNVSASETVWVTDETNELTEETVDAINKLNEEVFPQYDIKPQLAVEVLEELPEGYTDIDDYRTKRFEELGVGDAEYDSGILYVIALKEQAYAIETGYGIEPIIRDIDTNTILWDTEITMAEYSIAGSPDYLNASVQHVVGEVAYMLEQHNGGNIEQVHQEAQDREELREDTLLLILAILELSLYIISGVYIYTTFKYIKDSVADRKKGNKLSLTALFLGYCGVIATVTWEILKVVFKILYYVARIFGGASSRSGGSSKRGSFGGGRSGGGGSSGGW